MRELKFKIKLPSNAKRYVLQGNACWGSCKPGRFGLKPLSVNDPSLAYSSSIDREIWLTFSVEVKKKEQFEKRLYIAGDCKFKPAIYSTVHFTTCLKSTAKCTHALSVFTSLCSADRKAVKSLTKQCFAAIAHNVIAAKAATSCNFTAILFIPKCGLGFGVRNIGVQAHLLFGR